MTAILTIDPNGSISLLQSFLDKFHVKLGATLLADVSDAPYLLSVKTLDEVRQCDAEQSTAEAVTPAKGMKENMKEFNKAGAGISFSV